MRLVINIFIIIHLLLITAWLFPIGPYLVAFNTFFSRYTIFLGFDQNYSMFAPVVRKTNRHLLALITFHDLSTVIWSYPRIERMGIIEAMQKERYRKFANDNIVVPTFKMFWPDFARYIARAHVCTDNKPELVSIYLIETDISEPGQQLSAIEMNKNLLPNEKLACRLTNIFTYQVEAEDLK